MWNYDEEKVWSNNPVLHQYLIEDIEAKLGALLINDLETINTQVNRLWKNTMQYRIALQKAQDAIMDEASVVTHNEV